MMPYRIRVQTFFTDPDPIPADAIGVGASGIASPNRASWTIGLLDLVGGDPQRNSGAGSDSWVENISESEPSASDQTTKNAL